MRTITIFTMLFLGFAVTSISAQKAPKPYKSKMNDPKVNFYDVSKEAETYFETHHKGKGSGWKGYQRWMDWHQGHYFPDGNRNQVDPYFTSNAYKKFLQNNGQSRFPFPSGWNDLGPYDANNITSHYSPGIGRVECFYVNRNNMQRIYLGSRSGGFWRSSDGGNTWENTTDYLFASGVNTMDAAPSNPDSILINIRNAGNGTSHGIYRSTDAGATWTLTAFNPANLGWGGLGDNAQIYKIVYHPTIPDLIFVGTSEGLYRSTDNLQTWTQASFSSTRDIEFHPTNPNIIYFYQNGSTIRRTTDLGITFSSSNTLTGNNGLRCKIAVTPACPTCVYAASTNGVWRSDDEGQTFVFLSNPSESCDGFAVSDQDSLHMVYGYVDLEASNDGGYTFNQVTDWANSNPDTTYVHADLRTAECINGIFYVGTDGYLAMSPDNGLSWYRLNDGTGIREFYRVGISQSNWRVHMAGSQDNGTSILNDNGWIEWNGGDGMEAVIQPLNEQWMIGSWQFGTRNRTKNGGQTRQGIGTPQGGNCAWIAPMFIDHNEQMRVFHFGQDTVFVSDEFGTGWDTLGQTNLGGDILFAAMAYNNSNYIVVARNSTIKLSTNGGQTFGNIGSIPTGYSVSGLAFDPNNDFTLVVTYSRYQNDGKKVFITHNLGQTWTNITHNLGDMPIRSVAIDHTPDRNIYVGGEIGVYYKPMNGNTWTLYNTNLPNMTVRDLKIHFGSNTIKAATWGRGLWEYSLAGRASYPSILTTTITDAPTDELPKAYIPQDVTAMISYANTLSSVFVKWGTNNPLALDSVRTMSNTVDSTWITTSPIPGFVEGTKVYFRVYAVGMNGDTSETYRFMYTVRENEYCPSSGSLQYATSITSVNFADLSNNSSKTQGYTDYTATDSATVTQSNTYNLSVNLNTDGNYTIYAKAWIDWNRDFDFDDPNEEYDLGTAQNTTNGPSSFTPLMITVPNNAVAGKTRMRVSCLYNAAPGNCMVNVDGEVEDYGLFIQPIGLPTNTIPAQQIQIFPNPTDGAFYVDLGKAYQKTRIEILDVSGKMIHNQSYDNEQRIDLLIEQAAGVYIINVYADEEFGSYKIVKQ